MPNYELPQVQNPDILGAYIRGRAAPGALELQQQQVQEGRVAADEAPLHLQMLRQQLGIQQYYFDKAQHESAPDAGNGSAPSAPQADDSWGPGAILGHSVSKSSLSNQALGDLSVAMGKEDPLSASLKAAQADQAQIATNKELEATSLLDPKSGSGIPFGIQLTNMPSGNAQALMNNHAFMQQWPQHARNAGVDPGDIFADPVKYPGKADYAVKRVAYATVLPALQRVGKEGLVKAPEHFSEGTNPVTGEPIQTSDSTGQASAMPGYSTPGYTLKDSYDPGTGRNTGRLIQTSGSRIGGGAGAGGKGTGGASGAGGGSAGGIDLGMDKPTVDNQKAAKFALMFKTGTDTLGRMEQAGYDFSPKARGIILDAATNEGGLDKYIPGSAIFKQWMIKNGLSQKDQEYMAALMPALQAAGHSLGGARLTTSQIRSLYESILPVAGSSTEARAQVSQNREKMFRGLVAESGSAAYLPEYADTLGAYRTNISKPQSAAQGSNAPKVGSVVKGYRYKGGPPHQQSSWEKVGG